MEANELGLNLTIIKKRGEKGFRVEASENEKGDLFCRVFPKGFDDWSSNFLVDNNRIKLSNFYFGSVFLPINKEDRGELKRLSDEKKFIVKSWRKNSVGFVILFRLKD